MSDTIKRATVDFDANLYKALIRRLADTGHSLSEFVNEATHLLLEEDQQDLAAYAARVNEPEVTIDTLLGDLK